MTTVWQEQTTAVGRDRVWWRPEKLREMRDAHGLTLESAGETLRETARRAGLAVPAANFQTLWQHEQGEVYPGPHYRRAYCLMYGVSEPALGFRRALPGEDIDASHATESTSSDGSVSVVVKALDQLVPAGRECRRPRGAPAEGEPTESGDGGPGARIREAWIQRHSQQVAGRLTLVLVGGYAGSGKSEFSRFLAQLTGWALLDKDPITRPLVERLLEALGCDPNDRHTETYIGQVRPLEYQCLMDTVMANVEAGVSTIATAPFIAELDDSTWMRRLENRCAAYNVDVSTLWVDCDAESMHEYVSFRSAARDAWKLQHWAEYLSTLNLERRPTVPHIVIDNRYGAAIALADRTRRALRGDR